MSGALRVSNYRLQGAEVQVGCQSILRDGEQLHLRAKTFQVLLYLLDHRDRLVGKQELFDALWADAAVTDSSLVQCIIDLRKALADDARNPRYIKTVAKVGYQFIGPVTEVAPFDRPSADPLPPGVEVYRRCEVEYEEEEISDPSPAAATLWAWMMGRARNPLLAGLSILGIVAAAAAYTRHSGADVSMPQVAGKTRVAVLYFENQSHSERLDWLREGLADMTITELSRSSALAVLSRHELHSLLQRGGLTSARSVRLEDALWVARKSHAEVVAIGAFAELGDQIRVNLQLHDGATGRMLAVESFVAAGQDGILTGIGLLSLKAARDLGVKPVGRPSSIAPSVLTNNLEAYRNYSLGVQKSEAYHNTEATVLLERAIALDPQFAMAYARMGYNYAVSWILPDDARPYLEKAFALSSRLTERDRMNIEAWYAVANRDYPAAVERYRALKTAYPYDPEIYARLGSLLRGEDRHEEAVTTLLQGLAIDPDCKELYNILGAIYSQQGRHAEAIEMQSRHVALAPTEANAHDSLGLSYVWAGRHQDAEKEYLRAKQLDPAFDIVHGHLGALYVAMGRYREALQAFEKHTQAGPTPVQRGDGEFNAASLLWRMGQKSQALEKLARAIELQQDRIGPKIIRAIWLRDERAASALAAKLPANYSHTHRGSRPPTKRSDLYLLGVYAQLQGRDDLALERFREALRSWSAFATVDSYDDCVADAYLRMGRLDEAIAEYRRVTGLYPGRALTHYHLAIAYDRRGRTDEARAEIARFLELWAQADADRPEVQAARRYPTAPLPLLSAF